MYRTHNNHNNKMCTICFWTAVKITDSKILAFLKVLVLQHCVKYKYLSEDTNHDYVIVIFE